VLIVLLPALVLAACSSATQSPDPVTGTPSIAAQATATETQAPLPSPTSPPGKVLLVSTLPGQGLEAALADLIATGDLVLETRPALQPAELDEGVRVVVFAAPPPDLAEMLAAAPGVQFVVVSAVDATPTGNLSVIRVRSEHQAFLAGFISAVFAADWRAGGLLPADGPLGAGLQDAFVNGGRYYCGVCAPGWPLGLYYPQVGALPAASDGPTWQAAAAEMFDNGKVNLFFVSAEAAQPEAYSYLQGKVQFDTPVWLVGTQSPPEELRDQWLATVRLDATAALREIWPAVSSGQGGQEVDAALVIEDVAEDYQDEGRMRLAEELLAEIEAGRIYPFTLPAE
jgi:hypothetical protein